MGKERGKVKFGSWPIAALVTMLLALYIFLSVSAGLHKGAAFDEVAHLTAGYSYWKNDDFRLQPENGVFPQYWTAFPLLFGNYKFPSLHQPAWQRAEVFNLGHEFFYALGNKLDNMLFQGRFMTSLLGAALGLIVFFWARELFGIKGGIFSLLLFVFSPTMLAHGGLITSDMAVALWMTASLWALWKLFHDISWRIFFFSLVFFSLLILSKMSAVVVLPMVVILLGIRWFKNQPLTCRIGKSRTFVSQKEKGMALGALLGAHFIFAWLVIWAAYRFRYAASRTGLPFFNDWDFVTQNENLGEVLTQILKSIKALPEAFLYGFSFVLKYSEGRMAFLNGEPYLNGKWEFFPYTFLYKTPLPLIILLITAIAAWFVFKNREKINLYSLSPLFVLIGIYGFVCISSNLNLGHRHLIPIYPALYILAGMNVLWLAIPLRSVKIFVYSMLAWFVAESFWIRPHYLAYFNQLAGGPSQGYKHFVDSSLDWGQDLPGLKAWLDKNAKSQSIYLAYFGTGDPNYYGIQSIRLPGFFDRREQQIYAMNSGIYCISATLLQSIYTSVFGLWNNSCETQYLEALDDFRKFDATATNPAARKKLFDEKGETFWQSRWFAYERLRFARLCSFLRYREPDAQIGYSILIYRLSEKELQRALYDSPFEVFYNTLKQRN